MDTNSNQVYLRYFRLGDTAYREKVRFYEENPDAISSLYFDDRLEIDFDYLYCLFEVGRYERFLSKVDPFIELIVEENIYEFRGENIFQELLFRKAACLYQLKQYPKSEVILKQLVRMDRQNPLFIGLYTICKRKIENDIYITIKALAMAAFLIVLGITIARIFLEPFLAIYLAPFLVLRIILFSFGTCCLIGLELAFQYKIYKETGMFSHKLLNRIFGT
jgi:tetratricopeptide (TPR) repeat protein